MGRRKSAGWLEDLFYVAAKLPWWASLLLAVAFYIGFHSMAQLASPSPQDIGGLGKSVRVTLLRTTGMFLQYLIPVVFAGAAVFSVVRQRHAQKLVEDVRIRADASALLEMSWQDFERLVGEMFRRKGFAVVGNNGAGADGGIDLILKKGKETFLVQCKKWRATVVGVDVVRQLFGVMAAQGATGGFVVSAGQFSPDARTFAIGRNIELIDSKELLPLLGVRPSAPAAPMQANAMGCPICGAGMVKRIAKRGPNAGQAFLGCSTYPRCKGTRAL